MKKRIVYLTLLALTLWPLAHIGLAMQYGLSPWKLCGWGMYATPRLGTLGMEVFYRDAGADQMRQLTAPETDERTAANAFLERHRWLGALARPAQLAETVLRARPHTEALKIVVFRPVLERDSGMIVMTTTEWEYPR